MAAIVDTLEATIDKLGTCTLTAVALSAQQGAALDKMRSQGQQTPTMRTRAAVQMRTKANLMYKRVSRHFSDGPS